MRRRRRKREPEDGPTPVNTVPREAVLDLEPAPVSVTFVPVSQGGEGITREIVDALAGLVRRGLRKTAASARLKIPLDTFKYWLREGATHLRLYDAGRRAEIGLYGELVLALEAADAFAQQQCIDAIMGSEEPDLILKFMVKRWPKQFLQNGRKVIDPDDEIEETEQVDATRLIMERLKVLAPDSEPEP